MKIMGSFSPKVILLMNSMTPYPVKQCNKKRKCIFHRLKWQWHTDQCILLRWTTVLSVSLIVWSVLSFYSRALPLRSTSQACMLFLSFCYLLDLTFHLNALSIAATHLGRKERGAERNYSLWFISLHFLLWITQKYSNNKQCDEEHAI